LEAERRRELRLEIGDWRGEVGEGGEVDVDVAVGGAAEQALEVEGEESRGADDVERRERAEVLFVRGDFGGE
jgi:hypothetical protein